MQNQGSGNPVAAQNPALNPEKLKAKSQKLIAVITLWRNEGEYLFVVVGIAIGIEIVVGLDIYCPPIAISIPTPTQELGGWLSSRLWVIAFSCYQRKDAKSQRNERLTQTPFHKSGGKP